MSLSRVVPFNREVGPIYEPPTEKAVLGALIRSDTVELARERVGRLESSDFTPGGRCAVFAGIAALVERGQPPRRLDQIMAEIRRLKFDVSVTVAAQMELGDAEASASSAFDAAADRLKQLTSYRRADGEVEGLKRALHERATPSAVEEHLDGIRTALDGGSMLSVVPADFSGITQPDADEPFKVAGLLPPTGPVMLAAEWKAGKTLATYQLILDALNGRDPFGHFALDRPLRVQLWQLEMPLDLNLKRFRRLYRGADLDPELLLAQIADREFQPFVQPDLDLDDRRDRAKFHRAVSAFEPDLLILDSIGEAFGGTDCNDNSAVRRAIRQTLRPFDADGITTLVLHHKRKHRPGEKDDGKGSILGAQSFGAAVRGVFTLDRIADDSTGYTNKLTDMGSWDRQGDRETLLRLEDIGDDAVAVRALQGREKINYARQPERHAQIIADVVRVNTENGMPMSRADLDTTCKEHHDLTINQIRRGLTAAKKAETVAAIPDPKDARRVVLKPGSNA